jgi:UDPglucose 6-dehydrogenase
MSERFNVGVVGSGYVGLVTEACLSHLGHRVTCIDNDEVRLSALKEDRIPFYEPGLEDLVLQGVYQQRLSFADPGYLSHLVGEADAVFVTVNTSQGKDGSADLSSVADVARTIGRSLAETPSSSRERPLVVVNKCTVPVGSGDYVSMLIRDGIEEAGSKAWRAPSPSWPQTPSS